MEYTTDSPDETFRLAESIANKAHPGQIYCLTGDLGAGKTVFAQGFAKGLGVQGPVTSPTFTILQEYEGRCPFYHFDVYRLENPKTAGSFDLDEYFDGDGICLIEWAEHIQQALPEKDVVWIEIKRTAYEQQRIITTRGESS